jgi:hypothetical protein
MEKNANKAFLDLSKRQRRRRRNQALRELIEKSSVINLDSDTTSETESDQVKTRSSIPVEPELDCFSAVINVEEDTPAMSEDGAFVLEANPNSVNNDDLRANNHPCESSDSAHGYSSESSSTSDSSDSEHPTELAALSKNLAAWAVEEKTSEKMVGGLLSVLRTHACFEHLPKTKKGLIKLYHNKVVTKSVQPGKYYHFSITQGIVDTLKSTKIKDLENVSTLKLAVGIDGFKLANSSNNSFWGIAGSVSNLPQSSLFSIGIYEGEKKPKCVDDFLGAFVEEMVELANFGIKYKDKWFSVDFDALVCDTPAKAFVLQTLGHVGKISCIRCKAVGSRAENTTYFPTERGPCRSETDFRDQVQLAHHIGNSPLLPIPRFKFTENVPLDYMHLFLLGVMKKIMHFMFFESKKKVSNFYKCKVNSHITRVAKCMPAEFARKPRNLESFCHFKATEFRLFLLYIGPIIFSCLKQAKKEYYDSFMLLHCAASILCGARCETIYVDYAQDLLDKFVKDFPSIYGKNKVSSNVHALLHVKEDVKKFGCMDRFSAFPFESFYGKIVRTIAKRGQSLEQYVNRQREKRAFKKHIICSREATIKFSKPLREDVISNNLSVPLYKFIILPTFKISISRPNNCVMLKTKDVVLVTQIGHLSDDVKQIAFIGKRFLTNADLYEYPLKSSKIGILKCKDLARDYITFRLCDIKAKCVAIDLSKGSFAIYPLLHTLHSNLI